MPRYRNRENNTTEERQLTDIHRIFVWTTANKGLLYRHHRIRCCMYDQFKLRIQRENELERELAASNLIQQF